jgi:hypothetical protein
MRSGALPSPTPAPPHLFLFRDPRARWKMNNVFRDARRTIPPFEYIHVIFYMYMCMQFFAPRCLRRRRRRSPFLKGNKSTRDDGPCMQDLVCVFTSLLHLAEKIIIISGRAAE